MNIGTKTLLYGCHQFILHPIFVYTAWIKLYHNLPNPTETLCIIIHDWGYWGKPNLDGPEGEDHPRWAAEFIYRHALSKYGDYYALCMYHSRFQARKHLASVSRLCLPDKLGVALMPTWLWVGLGSLTHEVDEYMAETKYE